MRWRVGLWVVVALLALPAVALTAARLSGSDDGLVIKAVSFTPAGVLLYAACLLLLVALLLRPGGRGRRAPAVLAVLVAAGLATHVAWVAPWYVGGPAAASGSTALRVMSANMLGDEGDGTALVAAAAEADVDVLAVQEMSERTLAAMERSGLTELFPHRAGEAAPTGVRGTMVFAREPITDVERLPTVMGSWSVEIGGLRVFVVHPAYPLHPEDWRVELAALLEAAEATRPDLMLGDFNATLDHRPMRAFLDAGYRDAAELAGEGWQPTWPADGAGIVGLVPPLVQIDHVLVPDGWTAASTRTVHIPGADHRALVAEVSPG